MKSIKSGLFIGFFTAVMMLVWVTTLSAQSADKLVTQERIIPVQAGTAQLVNGLITIKLNDATLKQLAAKDASYYVSLTAIGDCGALKLKEKAGNQFTVQESSGSNAAFDYVVVVKKTVFTGIKPTAEVKLK